MRGGDGGEQADAARAGAVAGQGALIIREARGDAAAQRGRLPRGADARHGGAEGGRIRLRRGGGGGRARGGGSAGRSGAARPAGDGGGGESVADVLGDVVLKLAAQARGDVADDGILERLGAEMAGSVQAGGLCGGDGGGALVTGDDRCLNHH